MTTVAVIGAAGPLGRAVLEQLDGLPEIDRILGVDLVEPQMPVAKLSFRAAEARDPLLDRALAGAEVVVHLGPRDFERGSSTMQDRAVGGTRNVLAACQRLEIRALVHVSSGSVYGARSDNPIPLPESAPLRASTDFPYAHHHRVADELVTAWGRAHPDVRTVVLRPAVMLGPGVEDFATRHLLLPVMPLVRGCAPPIQVVHVDDVAAAVALAATGQLAGAYNVAADGWVEVADLSAILGRRPVSVPEQIAFSGAASLYRHGWLAVPPGALHYLMHPWVLSAARLHEAGWTPAYSNRETLRRFAADHAGEVALGPRTAHVRDLAAGAVAALALACAGSARAWRRRRPRAAGAACAGSAALLDRT